MIEDSLPDFSLRQSLSITSATDVVVAPKSATLFHGQFGIFGNPLVGANIVVEAFVKFLDPGVTGQSRRFKLKDANSGVTLGQVEISPSGDCDGYVRFSISIYESGTAGVIQVSALAQCPVCYTAVNVPTEATVDLSKGVDLQLTAYSQDTNASIVFKQVTM